ncbi:MAG: hypothetical protein KA007_00205 [Candidatus Pacebacteria bacterium]|nr:hypothetical protein [Candidatus Paceibacterota bacterium]
MNYNELHTAVESKEIVSAKTKEGKVYRLFQSTNGLLCYFPPRRSRVGFKVHMDLFETFVSFQGKKGSLSVDAKLKKQYSEIAKYKKLASEATFSHSWIDDCKNLPDFETWKNDVITELYGSPCEPRPKGLYDFHITTSNKIDGKVISLNRIAKRYPRAIQQLRDAIKEKRTGTIISNVRFAGYDMSISFEDKGNGKYMGYLSLEYKGTGNGYYYLLINDENFIGYDVD